MSRSIPLRPGGRFRAAVPALRLALVGPMLLAIGLLAIGLLTIGLSAIGLSLMGQPVPAGAQAAPVHVTTRTVPPVPDPGDDVTVKVRATGCPPGGALVEVYLTSSDGGSTAAALMARNEAKSTLFFRVKTEIDLPKAIEGWYGVRVVCGQFRPERLPMPGTTFRVGVNATKSMSVPVTEVVEGGTLHVSGNGCTGDTVEYAFSQSGLHVSPFSPQGNIPVNPDGTWAADVVAPPDLAPGKAEIRARCGLINQFGDQVWINYGGMTELDILRAPEVLQPVPVRPGT